VTRRLRWNARPIIVLSARGQSRTRSMRSTPAPTTTSPSRSAYRNCSRGCGWRCATRPAARPSRRSRCSPPATSRSTGPGGW
jgi:hypothetical protein